MRVDDSVQHGAWFREQRRHCFARPELREKRHAGSAVAGHNGLMTRSVHDRFEIRPGVFVFRNHMSRGRRVCECAGFVGLFVACHAAAFVIARPADGVEESASGVIAALRLSSLLFVLLALLVWLVPTAVLRVGPRGIRYAQLAMVPMCGALRRWHVKWCDVSMLKWHGARSRIVACGRKRSLALPGRDAKRDAALADALGRYLSARFDLSAGTVNERRRRRVRLWRWKRVAGDKLVLVGLVAGSFGSTLAVGIGDGGAWWWVAVVVWIVIHAIWVWWWVSFARFGWQRPSDCPRSSS